MVRTEGQDAGEQKVLDDIAGYGWHCVNILAERDLPPYAFTIGLFHSYGHPELIVFGLPGKVAHAILHIAAEAARDGKPLNLEEPTGELVEGYPAVFVPVPKSAYFENVGFARWFYEGDGFSLYQIVWPSRTGLFPWHPDATKSFRAMQPVLGIQTA